MHSGAPMRGTPPIKPGLKTSTQFSDPCVLIKSCLVNGRPGSVILRSTTERLLV